MNNIKKIEINKEFLEAIANEMKNKKYDTTQLKQDKDGIFKIKQYRPNFFSGFENEIVEFKTLEEFLNIEFVNNFTDIERYEGYKSKGFFVAVDEPMIFHVNYNPEQKQDEQWGVARVLEGDCNKLREILYNKYHIKSLV